MDEGGLCEITKSDVRGMREVVWDEGGGMEQTKEGGVRGTREVA